MKPKNRSNLMAQIAQLSPEKRAFLELKLKEKRKSAGSKKNIVRREQRDAVPLSFTQQRFWFLDQLEPDLPIYNEWTAAHLSGPLNIAVLEQSIDEMVRRHEALRTTFAVRNGQPVQIIAPVLTIPLPMIDLQGLPRTERWKEAERLVMEETQRLFDLERGPLLRVKLFQMDEQVYILLLTFHHIVIDAWSTTILYRELGSLYAAFLQQQSSPLPELPVQYADFAVWEREWLQSRAFESQLAYWQKQLADLSPLQLPTDRPRPTKQSYRGAQQSITFSASLVESLNTLSQQEGASLFMTLLAAFQTLLHRYSGQDDIVIGSPIANRNRPEIAGLIGCFTNTLTLRVDCSGNPTFRTLLSRVRTTVLDALAHQEMPFEKLVEELQPERDLSRTPLFQVMFVFNNTNLNFNQFGEVQASRVAIEGTTAKFDLTLAVIEFETDLMVTLEYNTDLFDRATIERMVGHLQTLLAGIVADPQQRICELPLLTEAERQQILVEWNATQTDDPSPPDLSRGTREQGGIKGRACLHQLFEQQVERTPDAVAVVFEEQHLTYQELNARANQLAHYLIRQGVGPEMLVGICVERSLEMMVGMLGILKAGGAYVPLDPAYPAERIAFILQETETSILLSQEQLLANLPVQDTCVMALDSNWAEIATHPTTNPSSAVAPHNLAYVIYTSGSTGKPKGVLIEHESVAAHCTQYQRFYALTPADRALQLASFHFDASVEQIFPALLTGASVIVPEWDLDPVSFSQNLQRFGVTILDLAGAHLRILLQEWINRPALIADSPLRIVVVGADVMPVDLITLWRQTPLHETARLFNVYGPTETTVAATVFEITDEFDRHQARIPIGPPLANKKVYILDPQRQLVPIGMPGELYIGGIGPARGYLNRPELTKEKFIALDDLPLTIDEKRAAIIKRHSKTSVSAGSMHNRLYRTGDLVRWLPDGHIDFLGRIDQQVKIRSFRVELGEIEAVLNQHPAVQEVAVIVQDAPRDSRQKRLIAYLTPQLPDSRIPELRKYLKRKLPEYMVPDAFVMLDHFPKTPIGVLDRKALPAPIASQYPLSDTFVPPSTPAEETIAAIWSEVLRLPQVGIHDDFFEIGGHSLLATQVISRCREEFGLEIKLMILFESRTIAGLAARIKELKLTQELQQTVETEPEMREEITL